MEKSGEQVDRDGKQGRRVILRCDISEGLEVAQLERDRVLLGQPPFPTHGRQYSEETAREIDCAVRELTDHACEKALSLLTTFRQELEDSAVQLLEKETLRTEDLPRLDLRTLTAHPRTPHNGGTQTAALARDGDQAGTAALREHPH